MQRSKWIHGLGKCDERQNNRRSSMKATKKRQNFFAITIMALLLALSVPATGLGQSRSRTRHNRTWSSRNWTRHNNNWTRHYNKKCGKFVNCHDARNGRLDRPRARGDRVNYVVRRNRNRNFNDSDFRRRLVDRNRDLNDGRNFSRNRSGKHRDN